MSTQSGVRHVLMPPTPLRHPRPATRGPLLRRRRRGEDGQSLVEFSLILAPLLFLLLGIIQFGFVFQTYITLSTAAREAAREASIYVYDQNSSQAVNDALRNTAAKTALLGAFNGMVKTAPNFTTGSTWTTTTSGSTITTTNGDLRITYTLPTTVTDSDPRTGWRITVQATYHQDLIIPLISSFLPKDGNGRLPLGAEVTMVIN
jgi:Flp pilus assembly protein TadG